MLRKWLFCGVAAGVLAVVLPAGAGQIDQGLQEVIAEAEPGEVISSVVFLKQRVDILALDQMLEAERAPLSYRHELVVTTLRATAEATQTALRDHLKDLELAGRIERFDSYWITNAFRVDAPADELELLAQHPDVDTIYYNYRIEMIGWDATATGEIEPASGQRTPEPGLVAIRAPEAWAAGYTGLGVLVATLDTGVDGNHPALASRWRGLDPAYAGHPEWAFFDPVTGQTFPFDSGSHGTHTMGTVCGGAPGDQVGVAPGAEWIHAAVIDRVDLMTTVTDAIEAFQWLIDPDGDPGTMWDVPAVCSNSWGIGTWHGIPPYSEPCDDSFWSYLDACEAAGIVILFSAGNEGPDANSLRRPADRATDEYRTCAVGGIDGNAAGPPWPMYTYSSRGPTYCTPSGDAATKPEITAPAVSVRSSVPGGGYTTMSGTSMASPHVNGVVALMREACPDLSVQDVKQILYDTALDQGPTGKDNDYGYGVVDAYEAVLMAESLCGPTPPRVFDASYETPVDTPLTITLQATDYDGLPDPPGALTYQIRSLPDMPLTDPGNGHVIGPGDLPYTLANGGNQVVYTPSGGYYGYDTFLFGANDGGTPPEGGDSEDGTITILVLYDPPTITTTTLPDGCVDHNYGPVYLQADQGQPTLTWSIVSDEYLEIDMGDSYFAEVGAPQNWHADDNSWSYTLPFVFPFFGQDYTSVWVCSNGFLDFASSSSDYSDSEAELIDNVRIAPLWDDIETDCGGDDDIYIQTGLGQVTIRWAGKHYSCDDDMDFSVTLYWDGTIRFHYGGTNTGLSPTIGISAGDGTHYLIASYSGSSTLTWANSLELVQPVPLPEGLELQADGAIVGVPTQVGSFEPRFKVTDSLGRSDVAQIPLTITQECQYAIGDLNCNGVVDAFDIDPFILALTDPAAYGATYPDCNVSLADCNQDGEVNAFDIDPFVELLIGG